MANQGAKKRKGENARHMANLRLLVIICNVIYVLVRMVIFYSSITWKHWMGLILTSLAYIVPYQQLSAMASPTYAEDGELIDGGLDMSAGGICGYLHDIIYITVFVQFMSIISEKFWLTYLLVPAFVAYKFSAIIGGFLSLGSSQRVAEDDKETRAKRRDKAHRRKIIHPGNK